MSQVSTQNVKSTLAKLLAGENISVQHKRVRTASFDVKNRVLTLPIYKTDISSEVYDTFVAHEVGHALWTPADESVLRNKKLFPYINLVEDIRIEKRIKNKFGGLVKSFVAGYNELWKEGFFGVTEDNIPDLSFADKLNINAKIGIAIDFSKEEEILVKKAKSCITFAEVVEVAEEIRAYCKDEQEQEKEEEQENTDKSKDNSCDNDDSGSDEECEDCESGSSSGEDSDEESDDCESGSSSGEDSDEESESGSSSGEESDDCESESGSSSGDDSDDDFDESEILKTQKNFDNSVEDTVDHTAKDPLYLKLPEFDLSYIIVSSDEVLQSVRKSRLNFVSRDTNGKYNDFKKSNLNIVNHLLKQFEMKKAASLYKKASESKTGTIDVNKIYRYSYDDNIFKRNTVIPEGKNHGLVLFLDWSGSMYDKFNPTIQQTLNLVFFCKKAGIAFDVYGFVDRNHGDGLDNKLLATGESNLITPNTSFQLLHLISSTQKGSTFNEAASNLFWLSYFHNASEYTLGNTPLHSALIVAPQILRKFKEKNNLQAVHMVILTDGYPSDSTYIRHTSNTPYYGASCVNGLYSTNTYIVHKNKNYPTSTSDNSPMSRTISLLNFVKDVAGVTITGFFLTPESGYRVASSAFGGWKSGSSWEDKQNAATTFTKEKSFTLSDCGFDEIHFISSKTKHLSTDGDIQFPTAGEDVKKALREVNKAFKKIGSERNKKRVVLNRFIELISKPKTIV